MCRTEGAGPGRTGGGFCRERAEHRACRLPDPVFSIAKTDSRVLHSYCRWTGEGGWLILADRSCRAAEGLIQLSSPLGTSSTVPRTVEIIKTRRAPSRPPAAPPPFPSPLLFLPFSPPPPSSPQSSMLFRHLNHKNCHRADDLCTYHTCPSLPRSSKGWEGRMDWMG